MVKFLTESGSTYEIDLVKRKIRRLGQNPGTERAGNGEWRQFLALNEPKVGHAVLIQWRINPDSLVLETTLTSRVERVWLHEMQAN